jgi:2-oxoglutarate dehydrogenase E1 component
MPPLGGDSAYLLDLYARYRRDRTSVPADLALHYDLLAEPSANELTAAYRAHGHHEAKLDPLGGKTSPHPLLARLRAADGGVSFRIADLHAIYAGTTAIEAEHVADEAARNFLYDSFEAAARAPDNPAARVRAQNAVAVADDFECFLARKFPGKKRFGLEGAESLIVWLREMMLTAANSGVTDIVMGGMHRGRLATLATVLGKPLAKILAEMKGHGADGDVPYHQGFSGEITIGDRSLSVHLSPHPSHLITVAPVTLGIARAKQNDTSRKTLCVLLHTDAAFAGQGVVAEILQLSGLAGYSVGGTIHLVVNNRIGFTTEPAEARTAQYCTDIGKLIGAPILHVNGDAPLAVGNVARLAVHWQQMFGRDILVDFVCYRRNGHNELDEPRFTQPARWQEIDRLPPLRQLFGEPAETAEIECFRRELAAAYEAAAHLRPNHSEAAEHDLLHPVSTGVAMAALQRIGHATTKIPDGFAAHPKVERFYRLRSEAISVGVKINFATAEALAFATLLDDGIAVRLSGQDSVRGTFTQRHLAVHDMFSGARTVPLALIGRDGATFEAINSPLSEYATLGFEYGYSTAALETLVIWEAQFGDFLNGAQIVVDQYIVSAEAKWGLRSGLVVMLPHGLEGQGPDHSSARIERILQLCAGDNVIVAQPSTPANLFHLLRRQIKAGWRKPLFLIGPKSLLRRSDCTSELEAMAEGTSFQPVLPDRMSPARHVILCSGKLYFDLKAAKPDDDTVLVRLEQFYPFPEKSLRAVLDDCAPQIVTWCQEEPENQGALGFLARSLGPRFRPVARPAMPAPAGGSLERHEAEQIDLIRRALMRA